MKSVTKHAHARMAVARITQRMWHVAHMYTCTLRGHFGSRRLLFFLKRELPARCSSLASQNGGGEKKKMATGARTGCEPSGALPRSRHAKSHSSNIVDVFSDILDKAQIELDDARHAAHSFSMLQQSLVVDAAAFSSAEKQGLVALVQSRQASDVDDSDLSAPAAAVYVSHSSDFEDVLNDLLRAVGRKTFATTKAKSKFNNVHSCCHSLDDIMRETDVEFGGKRAFCVRLRQCGQELFFFSMVRCSCVHCRV